MLIPDPYFLEFELSASEQDLVDLARSRRRNEAMQFQFRCPDANEKDLSDGDVAIAHVTRCPLCKALIAEQRLAALGLHH